MKQTQAPELLRMYALRQTHRPARRPNRCLGVAAATLYLASKGVSVSLETLNRSIHHAQTQTA
jgi:hypothetical protein